MKKAETIKSTIEKNILVKNKIFTSQNIFDIIRELIGVEQEFKISLEKQGGDTLSLEYKSLNDDSVKEFEKEIHHLDIESLKVYVYTNKNHYSIRLNQNTEFPDLHNEITLKGDKPSVLSKASQIEDILKSVEENPWFIFIFAYLFHNVLIRTLVTFIVSIITIISLYTLLGYTLTKLTDISTINYFEITSFSFSLAFPLLLVSAMYYTDKILLYIIPSYVKFKFGRQKNMKEKVIKFIIYSILTLLYPIISSLILNYISS